MELAKYQTKAKRRGGDWPQSRLLLSFGVIVVLLLFLDITGLPFWILLLSVVGTTPQDNNKKRISIDWNAQMQRRARIRMVAVVVVDDDECALPVVVTPSSWRWFSFILPLRYQMRVGRGTNLTCYLSTSYSSQVVGWSGSQLLRTILWWLMVVGPSILLLDQLVESSCTVVNMIAMG